MRWLQDVVTAFDGSNKIISLRYPPLSGAMLLVAYTSGGVCQVLCMGTPNNTAACDYYPLGTSIGTQGSMGQVFGLTKAWPTGTKMFALYCTNVDSAAAPTSSQMAP